MDYLLRLTVISSLLSICTHSVNAGSCWYSLDHKNTCSDLISAKMTRKECCEADPKGEKFYSEDESTLGSFDLRFIMATHKCGMACDDGCETFKNRCKDTEICKIKNGIPRCLCDPNCAMHTLSKKGPICGTDLRTYRSHCSLLRQNCRKNKDVEVSYFGQCRESTCDGVVCAKDGYKCVTDQYNLPTCVPLPTHCEQNPKASLQICATNDETFPSLCHMTRYNIEKGLDLRLQYHGKCRDRMSCDKDSLCKACLYDKNYGSHVCTTEDCPTCSHVTNDSPQVCGDDGNTYENECMLRRHACLNRINISVKHAAPCGASKDEILSTNILLRIKDEDDILQNLLLDAMSS